MAQTLRERLEDKAKVQLQQHCSCNCISPGYMMAVAICVFFTVILMALVFSHFVDRRYHDSVNSSADVGVQATPAVLADLSDDCSSDRFTSDGLAQGQTNPLIKTPMCLVNELARFNKLSHRYILVDEKGPAHKKEFFVKLEIGNETFQSSGSSIKRAQHAAAAKALEETKLKRPSPRAITKQREQQEEPQLTQKPSVTPTVELNAMVMKLGVHAEYTNIEVPKTPYFPPPIVYPHVHDPFRRMRSPFQPPMRFMPPSLQNRMSRPVSRVLLKIGDHEFRGEGSTRQHARHDAASMALKVLKSCPLRINGSPINTPLSRTNSTSTTGKSEESKEVDEDNSELPAPDLSSDTDGTSDSALDNLGKSEISLILEIACQNNKAVRFTVVDESGPPHMRKCECGDHTSVGEGNSKKSSKKVAAKLMLEKLISSDEASVASTTQSAKQKVKNIANKKKNRNLIKMQKANMEYGNGIHPVSRLIQIQQASKKKEPVYTLIMDHGQPRRREFIIQVECNDLKCFGKGPNKKLAKRNAADEMLQLMGYSKPSPTPSKSALKSVDQASGQMPNQKHVTFSDNFQSGKVPGVLVRSEGTQPEGKTKKEEISNMLVSQIAQELLDAGLSKTAKSMNFAFDIPSEPLTTYKARLELLAKCMGTTVDFTGFPKGTNTNACLSLVALQTTPPQVFHGSAPTNEEADEKAALLALKKLVKNDDPSSPSPASYQVNGVDRWASNSMMDKNRLESLNPNGQLENGGYADSSSLPKTKHMSVELES